LPQFVSPDDEHNVLETFRELKIKLNTEKRTVHHVGHLPRRLFPKSLPKKSGNLNLLELSGPVQPCNEIAFTTIAWVNIPRASVAQE
jgi:hypothetical protein